MTSPRGGHGYRTAPVLGALAAPSRPIPEILRVIVDHRGNGRNSDAGPAE